MKIEALLVAWSLQLVENFFKPKPGPSWDPTPCTCNCECRFEDVQSHRRLVAVLIALSVGLALALFYVSCYKRPSFVGPQINEASPNSRRKGRGIVQMHARSESGCLLS